MAFDEKLSFVLQLDANGAIRGFGQLRATAARDLGEVDDRLDRIGRGMQRAGAAALAGAGVAGRALYGLAQASEEANLAEIRLNNSIRNSPALVGESADRFVELAEAIQSVTAADGDAIVEAEAMLATFRLTAEEIEAATPLVVDYSRKFGVDLVAAATQVGKAFQGNIGTLQRNGILIDENAFATDRFTAVIDALRENVGGFAEAEGRTFAGQVERMKNELGDLAEGVGVGVVDAFTSLIGPVSAISDRFANLDPATQSLIGKTATYGTVLVGVAGAASFTVGSILRMHERFTAAGEAISGFVTKAGGIKPVLVGATAAIGVAATVMVALGNQSRNAEARADEYTEAIQRQTGALEENVDAVTAKALADSGLAGDVAEAGGNLEVFAEAVREGTVNLDELEDLAVDIGNVFHGDVAAALRASEFAATDLGRELILLAEAGLLNEHQFSDVVNTLINQRQAYQAGTQAANDLAFAEEAVGAATDDATGATDDNTGAVRRNTLEQERNKKAIEDRLEAIRNSYQATNALFEAEIAHRDAQRRGIEAQNELNQVIADHGENSWEARAAVDAAARALNDQASAAVDLFVKTAELNGETLTAGERAEIHRQALLDMREELSGPLASALDGHIARLAAIPRFVDTVVSVLPGGDRTLLEQETNRDNQIARNAGKSTVNNVTINATTGVTAEEIAREITWAIY